MDVWMKGRRPEILALRPAATQVTRNSTSWAMFMMTMTVFVLVVMVVVAAVVMMFESTLSTCKCVCFHHFDHDDVGSLFHTTTSILSHLSCNFLQLTFLGYCGSSGAAWIDGAVMDRWRLSGNVAR